MLESEFLNTAATTVANSSEILKEIYDDVAKPTAQNIGQALGTISSTLNVLLAPLSWAVYGFNIINEKVTSALSDKLSGTPIDELSKPEPNIVIPAYEALRYSLDKEDLKDMYINLIASSMKNSEKEKVHPAFVEIIKQLSPFDASLLKKLADTNTLLFGIIKTRVEKSASDREGLDWIHHIISPYFGINLSNFEKYQVSLENLQRLQLIDIKYDIFLVDDSVYSPIENGDIVTYCKNKAPSLRDDYQYFRCKKGELVITNFGKEFISVCIK